MQAQIFQTETPDKFSSNLAIKTISESPIKTDSRKAQLIVNGRYHHTSFIANNKLFIYGGIGEDNEAHSNVQLCLKKKFLSFDISSNVWKKQEIQNVCQSRSGHSTCIFKQSAYSFGGVNAQGIYRNDVISFCSKNSEWKKQVNKGIEPSTRQRAIMEAVRDQYIFMYGGINLDKEKRYNQSYIFKDNEWIQLTYASKLKKKKFRDNATISFCNNKLYMFGGEGTSEIKPTFFDDLYHIVINRPLRQFQFQKIHSQSGKSPAARASHGMVVFKKSLIVFGGQGDGDSKQQIKILNDLWVFNTEQLYWSEIQVKDNQLDPRFLHTLSIFENQIFIFGGFNNQRTISNKLVRIQLIEQNKNLEMICKQCEERQIKKIEQEKDIQFVSNIEVSTGYYYNLAFQIKFPFKAINLIINAAEYLKASKISISSCKSKESLDYLKFDFDAQQSFSYGCFHKIIETYNIQESYAIFGLKVGSFRLGKTFVYISVDKFYRKVMMMSADSRFNPGYQDSIVYYFYIEDLKTKNILSQHGQISKQIIYNTLKNHFQDPFTVLSQHQGHKLYIFHPNILPTAENTFYYQLVFYQKPEYDIRYFTNQKKIAFLDNLGYSISRNSEISLISYLHICKTVRSLDIYINEDPKPIRKINYEQILAQAERNNFIYNIDIQLVNKFVTSCKIFRCRKTQYFKFNNGILIFHGEDLFDRYQCEFGKLFSSKFYKKLYKSESQNIFAYVGFIHISSQLQMNLAKTHFKYKNHYNSIIEELTIKLKSLNLLKKDKKKNYNNSTNHSDVYIINKINKKIKTD